MSEEKTYTMICIEEFIEAQRKLEAVRKILDGATGGELYIKHVGNESWVKYKMHMKYYHAVCNALELLENSEFMKKGEKDE